MRAVFLSRRIGGSVALWPSGLKASPRQHFGTSFVAVNNPVSRLRGNREFFQAHIADVFDFVFFPRVVCFHFPSSVLREFCFCYKFQALKTRAEELIVSDSKGKMCKYNSFLPSGPFLPKHQDLMGSQVDSTFNGKLPPP